MILIAIHNTISIIHATASAAYFGFILGSPYNSVDFLPNAKPWALMHAAADLGIDDVRARLDKAEFGPCTVEGPNVGYLVLPDLAHGHLLSLGRSGEFLCFYGLGLG